MKKHHWHAFRHKKLFEKQPLPHCQALSKKSPCRSLYLENFLRGKGDGPISMTILRKISKGWRRQLCLRLYLEKFLRSEGKPKKGQPILRNFLRDREEPEEGEPLYLENF